MNPEIKPGGVFPDFELPNQDGETVKLSDVMEGKPVVLTFNRGNY